MKTKTQEKTMEWELEVTVKTHTKQQLGKLMDYLGAEGFDYGKPSSQDFWLKEQEELKEDFNKAEEAWKKAQKIAVSKAQDSFRQKVEKELLKDEPIGIKFDKDGFNINMLSGVRNDLRAELRAKLKTLDK